MIQRKSKTSIEHDPICSSGEKKSFLIPQEAIGYSPDQLSLLLLTINVSIQVHFAHLGIGIHYSNKSKGETNSYLCKGHSLSIREYYSCLGTYSQINYPVAFLLYWGIKNWWTKITYAIGSSRLEQLLAGHFTKKSHTGFQLKYVIDSVPELNAEKIQCCSDHDFDLYLVFIILYLFDWLVIFYSEYIWFYCF